MRTWQVLDLLYDKSGGEFPGTVGIVECDGGHQILPIVVHTGGAAAVQVGGVHRAVLGHDLNQVSGGGT